MYTKQAFTTDYRHYGEITVPAGTLLTHQTASGIDKKYHFVAEFDWIKRGYPDYANVLKMDAENYGINVPKELVCFDDDYNSWERTITNIIIDRFECTNGDAQSIVEAQDFYMVQSWGRGLSPAEAAEKIIDKATVKEG